MYNIAIGSDHQGYELKTIIHKYLLEHSVSNVQNIIDVGTYEHKQVDYPDIAKSLCDTIINKEAKFGILICATGIGMAITANRYSEIRAALCTNAYMAEISRLHHNANILALGAKISNTNEAISMVNKFFDTKFEGGRHLTRIEKI